MTEWSSTTTVRFRDKEFRFAVSETAQELMKGLAGIESWEAAGVDGMLFDFGTDFEAIMTPNGLRFPVEVAFLDFQGNVLEILTLNPAFGHNVFSSNPIRYALEVPVGFLEDNRVTVGTRLEI